MSASDGPATDTAGTDTAGTAASGSVWPRYCLRNRQVMAPGFWIWTGPPGWFVCDRRTGGNVTAEILDPFLPVGSPFRGRRHVSERQGALLVQLANDPDGANAVRAYLMDKLKGGS